MSLSGLLKDTGTIKRVGRTATGQGGFAEALADVETNIPCRVHAASSADRQIAVKDNRAVTHASYWNAGIDVKRKDTVVINGTTFSVVALLPPSKAHHLKVLLEEIQEGG